MNLHKDTRRTWGTCMSSSSSLAPVERCELGELGRAGEARAPVAARERALSDPLSREFEKDRLIREQQSEIARLRAENDTLRTRLESVSRRSSVRRVSSGVGFSSSLFHSGRSPEGRDTGSLDSLPPASPIVPARPLSDINSGIPPSRRRRLWSNIRGSTSMPQRLNEMDIARHGGPILPVIAHDADVCWARLASTTLSPMLLASESDCDDDIQHVHEVLQLQQ